MKQIRYVLLVQLILCLFAAVALAGPGLVKVPNVVGMKAASAVRALKQAGLKSKTTKVTTAGRIGTVARILLGSKEIRAGRPVRKGTTIVLAVVSRASEGTKIEKEELIKVPDLKGLTEKESRRKLSRVGLALGKIKEKEVSTAKAGTVFDQEPKRGKSVKKRTRVNIVLARAVLFAVPNLVGKSEKEARRILSAHHLKPGRIAEKKRPGRKAGSVIQQKPSAKSRVEKNSRIDLTIVAEKEIKLPRVVGLDLAKAEMILKQHGFKVEAEYECCPGEFNPNLPAGKVVKVKQAKGKLIKGMLLTLLVPKPMTPGIGGGSPADLIIDDVVNIECPDSMRLYEPYGVSLTFIAKNVGGLPTGPFAVRWYPHKNNLEEPGCEVRHDAGLEPGQSQMLKCNSYTYSSHGNMHWMAVVDEQSEVENEVKGNNRFYGEVLVRKEDKPDLVITDAHYKQQKELVSTLKSGKRFKAVFTVENQGSVAAEPFNVIWRFENGIGLDNCCSTKIKKSLQPGGQVTKEFRDLTAPVITERAEEDFSAIVDVDPENVVNEGHAEDNNEQEHIFYVRQQVPEAVGHLHVCDQGVEPWENWNKIYVTLCWDDLSDNEDGFQVEAKTTIPTLVESREMGIDVENYMFQGLSCEASYDFTVSAFNEAGASDPTTLRVTTSACDKHDLYVSTLTVNKQNDTPGTYDIYYEIKNRNTGPNQGGSDNFEIIISYPYCREGERLVKNEIDTKFVTHDGNEVVDFRGASDTRKIKARCLSGKEDIKITVDWKNDIEEVNENNNEKTTTVNFK